MSNIMEEIWVGIDVSKAHLDIALGASGEFWRTGNNAMGIAQTAERLVQLKPQRVVVEVMLMRRKPKIKPRRPRRTRRKLF